MHDRRAVVVVHPERGRGRRVVDEDAADVGRMRQQVFHHFVPAHARLRCCRPRDSGKGRHIHQRSDQTQQGLLLRPARVAQEFAQFDVRELAARRRVGLMDDEGMAALGFAPDWRLPTCPNSFA